MNTKDKWGRTAWHLACIYGRTDIAQLIIRYSKDFGMLVKEYLQIYATESAQNSGCLSCIWALILTKKNM